MKLRTKAGDISTSWILPALLIKWLAQLVGGQAGVTSARVTKVARRDGTEFDCAPWVHKAKELPKEEFRREVDRYLSGKETEPWEIIYFKLYKSQLPVIERALETAALMLGGSKSRGYCLEMICADFLAGARLEGGNSDSLVFALGRLYSLLTDSQKTDFVKQTERVSNG